MAGVFISYRRADSAYALLLYKAMSQRFGPEQAFRDMEDIQAGEDFVAALDGELARAAACVVIIGSGWLTSLDRLRAPEDFVRREIATVLQRDALVLPCLVGGAEMPVAGSVPEALAPLLRKNAIAIDDGRFDRDTETLLATLEKVLPVAPAARPSAERNYRELRAVELLSRQVHRLQIRAVRMIQAQELDAALDELSEGFDVIMQLLEWSPNDLGLDLQLAYMYKTVCQAFQAAGHDEEADRYLNLTATLFERVKASGGLKPEDLASALNGLGNIYYQRGEIDKAIHYYELALELIPVYAYAWHDLLGAYLMKARNGEIDLPAMEHALAKVKQTGRGVTGLDAAYIAQLDGMVARWRHPPTDDAAGGAKKPRARSPKGKKKAASGRH